MFIGFWLFLGYATQTIGLLYTTSSKAGFITGLSVVLVPLFSMLLLKQTLSKNAIIGVIIATIGLVFAYSNRYIRVKHWRCVCVYLCD